MVQKQIQTKISLQQKSEARNYTFEVQKLRELNPDFQVHCFTDELELETIKNYGNEKLLQYYLEEPKGMYRTDIWRLVPV